MPFTHFDLHTKAMCCVCVLLEAIIHLSTAEEQLPGSIRNRDWTVQILCLVTCEFCVLSVLWKMKFQFSELYNLDVTSGTRYSHYETKYTATQNNGLSRWLKYKILLQSPPFPPLPVFIYISQNRVIMPPWLYDLRGQASILLLHYMWRCHSVKFNSEFKWILNHV